MSPARAVTPPALYVDEILECYGILSSVPSLKPAEDVNRAFGRLVAICTLVLDKAATHEILYDPSVLKVTPHLRALCSTGEGLLEAHWADKITYPSSCAEPLDLQDFPYYDNYVELTRLELSIVHTANKNPQTFAFLGCGPLPLTSFCILQQLQNPEVSIVNVDHSSSAINKATALAQHVGFSKASMKFCCDVAGGLAHDLGEADVVYFAALVGSTGKEKKELLRKVIASMKPGGLVVIRSARGLRKLLYPKIRIPEDVDIPGFEVLTVVHPYNSIVNSIVLGRVL